MIRKVGETIGRAVLDGIGRAASRVQERKGLPADLLESDAAYLVVFDAPGANANDVQVRFEGNRLTVQIERYRQFYDDFEMRFPGRGLGLTGSITLPEEADVTPEDADATITNNGTLEILIPKADTDVAVVTDAESDSEAASTAEPDRADTSARSASDHTGDVAETSPEATDETSTDA